MTREYNVIIERDQDGYFVGTVPELHGCHTQAKSLDALMKRIREAIYLFLHHPDGRSTVVPVHRGEIIGAGLMSKILRDIEMTREEFMDIL